MSVQKPFLSFFFTALIPIAAFFSSQAHSQANASVVSGTRRVIEGGMPKCGPPKIETEILSQPAELRHVASVKTMTEYSNSSHPTVGLYRSRQRVYLRGQRIGSAETNEICINALSLTYAINHAIDVGTEYRPGTCAFEETVKHERTHERIHLQKAKEAQNHIVRELGREPLYFSGPTYQQDADTWMNKAVQWATQVYSGYIMPAQEAFDSPEEYQRFSKACGHELRYHGYNGAGTPQ